MPPTLRTPTVRVMVVLLNDREVGTLTHLPGESTPFSFSDDYVQAPVGERALGELRKVLRQKIGLEAGAIEDVEAFLRRQGHVVRSKHPPVVRVRDADDSYVLMEAIEAGVDAVVTGDRDMLAVAAKVPFAIVTPRGFWSLLRGKRSE